MHTDHRGIFHANSDVFFSCYILHLLSDKFFSCFSSGFRQLYRGKEDSGPLWGSGVRPAGLDREDHRSHQQSEICQLTDRSPATAAGVHNLLHYREAHQVRSLIYQLEGHEDVQPLILQIAPFAVKILWAALQTAANRWGDVTSTHKPFPVSWPGFRRKGTSKSFFLPSKANSEPITRNLTCLMTGSSSQTSTRSPTHQP